MTPRIGLLWGDFPWDERGRRVGKLLSMGAVGRVTSRALGAAGRVLPYRPPASAAPEAHRAALAAFLRASDVLVADVYESSAPALRLRHELGLRCPALLFAGGAMPKGAEAMLFPWRDLLRPGDGLWFSSVADQRIWRRLVRRSALREWVIPIGVDDALFRPHTAAERRAARLAGGLPPDDPLLLAVGRLNVQKGLHLLLPLLAAVRRDVPRAHLCFTGETDDIGLHEFGVLNTGYVPWLRRQADALGLTGAVTFSGPRLGEDLAALTAAADVAVSASVYHRENGGLAPAEAQASGVPVVCTAWGGLKDVVQDGETGYLMDAVLTANGVRVDWAAGAAAVTALLRDPTARAAMGARAAARARQRYGLAAFADALAGAVAAALASPGDERGAPYEPSAFAARFEARKRAAGWYAAPTARAGRRPPQALFAGHAYRLYERLMAPYATHLASALDPRAVGPDWTPYFPSPVTLDGLRSLAEDGDPIWPHRRFLRPAAWAVLRRVDGVTTVAALTAAATAEHPALDGPAVAALLRALYADGFVLFRRPRPPPMGAEGSDRPGGTPAGGAARYRSVVAATAAEPRPRPAAARPARCAPRPGRRTVDSSAAGYRRPAGRAEGRRGSARRMIRRTAIDGLLVIERSTRTDERGFFREPFRLDELEAATGGPVRFVQQNHARSRRGVLRGLHAENWEKLVYVPQGRVFVAVADIRPESATFGKVATFMLGDGADGPEGADGAAGEGKRLSLFLPRRLGHGYCVLSETADYVYLVTEYYDGSDTHAVRWDDPDLAVPWPAVDPILSERDRHNPSLREIAPAAFATA